MEGQLTPGAIWDIWHFGSIIVLRSIVKAPFLSRSSNFKPEPKGIFRGTQDSVFNCCCCCCWVVVVVVVIIPRGGNARAESPKLEIAGRSRWSTIYDRDPHAPAIYLRLLIIGGALLNSSTPFFFELIHAYVVKYQKGHRYCRSMADVDL